MFHNVDAFEKAIAHFYGAPYAVATDCCTHAIELSVYATETQNIGVPCHTYISVPFTMKKLNKDWYWTDHKWQQYHQFENTNIIDAAVYWQENGYIAGSIMCLSFQFKKHLNLGRGGMILTDDAGLAQRLKALRYDGRPQDVTPWYKQQINEPGFHYYMTPETAYLGLCRLHQAKVTQPKQWSWEDYPYLPDMPVFKQDKVKQ
jgi:dTDP-4-amino-4,6-dideoxygalactose transaminase